MSQKAAKSTPGHWSAWRTSSLPRAPTPMMPRRMRSFAPSTVAGTASVVARPEANAPRNLRREFRCGELSWLTGNLILSRSSYVDCRCYKRAEIGELGKCAKSVALSKGYTKYNGWRVSKRQAEFEPKDWILWCLAGALAIVLLFKHDTVAWTAGLLALLWLLLLIPALQLKTIKKS